MHFVAHAALTVAHFVASGTSFSLSYSLTQHRFTLMWYTVSGPTYFI